MSGIIISFNRMSIRSKLITIFSIVFTVGFVFNFIIASNKLRDETIRRWRRWPTSWRRIDYQEVSAPRIGNSGRAALLPPIYRIDASALKRPTIAGLSSAP